MIGTLSRSSAATAELVLKILQRAPEPVIDHGIDPVMQELPSRDRISVTFAAPYERPSRHCTVLPRNMPGEIKFARIP